MAKIPEVRIYFSWLLYDTVSGGLKKAAGSDEPLLPKETAEEYAGNYRNEWAKYNDKILHGLTDTLGVEFYRDVLDVPCGPWLYHISDPLMMGFMYYPSEFVDVLAHELAHVLLSDNTIYSMRSSEHTVHLDERWSKMFGKEHDFNTLVHIPVHALSQYLYLDVLQDPKRLERDHKRIAGNVPYEAAWKYVEQHGYKEIIEQLKADYQAIKQELKTA